VEALRDANNSIFQAQTMNNSHMWIGAHLIVAKNKIEQALAAAERELEPKTVEEDTGEIVYASGAPCPEGYLARYKWAHDQMAHGLEQTRCKCRLYLFPQEVATHKCKGEFKS
jgi:hypothetical protein